VLFHALVLISPRTFPSTSLIQASSSWSEENQDPPHVNTLTERLPSSGGVTFEQATQACADMGMSLVSASTPQGINNLLERAETGMQNLIWVGAEKEGNAKWRWPEAPPSCPLSEREFYPGDFTCHESAEGVSLLEAQQLCQAEGRMLKIPHNHHRATLQRISMSCPGFTRGCRICGAGTPEQEIIQYVCVDPTTGTSHGEQYVHDPARNWGSDEAVCVLQSRVWHPVTVKMLLEFFEGNHAPGLTCNDLGFFFETIVTATAPCSGLFTDTQMKRVAGARDVDFGCDVGSEPRIWNIDPEKSDVDRANFLYSCCPAQCSASGGRYHAFFCEGHSSYNADNTNKCLAVFKFENELQYISVDCSQNLSYVCQNPAVQTCDPAKCRGPDGQGGYDCYAVLQQHEDMKCAEGYRSQSIGEPFPFDQWTIQVC
jgi:hypothetical protein